MRKTYCNFSPEVFPGFYDTGLAWTEGYDGEIAEKFKGEYSFTFRDFGEYKMAVAKEWLSQMSASLDEGENPAGLALTGLESVWSPKEYNYYTDQLNINMEFDLRRLKRYCLREKRAEFGSYLREHWTSHDGFISFVPGRIDRFTAQYKTGKDRDSLVDVMAEFYLMRNIDFRAVEMGTYENLMEIQSGFLAMEDSRGRMCGFRHGDSGYEPLIAA